MGCIGFTPACCWNWRAARGQSVDQTSDPASFIPSKAFFPTRWEGSNPFTVMAKVPSWPQHSMTKAGVTPGIFRSRSRPLNPTPWARRWQGAW